MMCKKSLIFSKKIYVKGTGKGERGRWDFHPQLHSPHGSNSQFSGSLKPCAWQQPDAWAILHCLPRTMSRELEHTLDLTGGLTHCTTTSAPRVLSTAAQKLCLIILFPQVCRSESHTQGH